MNINRKKTRIIESYGYKANAVRVRIKGKKGIKGCPLHPYCAQARTPAPTKSLNLPTATPALLNPKPTHQQAVRRFAGITQPLQAHDFTLRTEVPPWPVSQGK